MQLVARSADVLRIISIHQFPAGTTATFDRSKTRAFITSFKMLFPTQRMAFSLDDIAAVQVRKRARQDGRFAYGLKLRRKRGGDIAMRCHSRDDAMAFRRAITEFLALP